MMAVQVARRLKNLAYLSGAEAAGKVFTFAAIAYLARVMGPGGYGDIEFASAVLFCAALIVDQGFNPYGAREIARDPRRTAEFTQEIVLARALMAILAYSAVVSFVLVVNPSAVVTQLLVIYAFGLLAMPLLLQWVFQGHERMHIAAAIQLMRPVVFAVLIFALVRGQAQIAMAAVSDVAGVVCAGLFGLWIYRRQFGGLAAPWRVSLTLFRESLPMGFSQMFWVFRMYGATLVLGLVASAQDVGYFGSAMRILVALHAFIWLYYVNLLPALARTWQNQDGSFSALVTQSVRGVAWLSAIGGSIWVVLAALVMVGVYGAAFAPAGVILQWLAGVFVIAALSGHYRYGLIAAGQQRAEMITSAVGSFTALILIPLLYGIAGPNGAAVALFAAEAVVLGTAWWWARQTLALNGHFSTLARPLIATLLVWGTAQLLPLPSESVRLVIMVVMLIILAVMLDVEVRRPVRQYVTTGWLWVRHRLASRVREAT